MTTKFDVGQDVKFLSGKYSTIARVKGISISLTDNINNRKNGEIVVIYTLSTGQRIEESRLLPVVLL